MNATACPYCRGALEPGSEDLLPCEGCGTEHHRDCYAENGGCTVFGCRCAPAEEPKVSVATVELAQARSSNTVRALGAPSSPPPPPPGGIATATEERTVEELGASVVPSIFGSSIYDSPAEEIHEPKSRTSFIFLGALLGALGAHNFYAGYKKKAFAQLALTILTLGFASPMTWIWAVIDICTIDKDQYGVNFTS